MPNVHPARRPFRFTTCYNILRAGSPLRPRARDTVLAAGPLRRRALAVPARVPGRPLRGLQAVEETIVRLRVVRQVPQVRDSTIGVQRQQMDFVDIESGSVCTACRFMDHDHGMTVVGEDAGDLQLLGSTLGCSGTSGLLSMGPSIHTSNTADVDWTRARPGEPNGWAVELSPRGGRKGTPGRTTHAWPTPRPVGGRPPTREPRSDGFLGRHPTAATRRSTIRLSVAQVTDG